MHYKTNVCLPADVYFIYQGIKAEYDSIHLSDTTNGKGFYSVSSYALFTYEVL